MIPKEQNTVVHEPTIFVVLQESGSPVSKDRENSRENSGYEIHRRFLPRGFTESSVESR